MLLGHFWPFLLPFNQRDGEFASSHAMGKGMQEETMFVGF